MSEDLGEDEWPSARQVAQRLDRTIESLRKQLAECQAQVKQAKREAYLELHDMAMHSSNADWMMNHCRQKANELKE